MKNNQLYPFERNRYYAGKMLTSADFQAEQTYFNNKRRFLNYLFCGSGVLCGLGVLSLDDLSLMVESGVAIDMLGREVVVDTSVVKKLSTIEGFETLKSNEAMLCLRYQEKEEHTVYAVDSRNVGREYEYNRIGEGYQLFLKDAGSVEEEFQMETEFLTSGLLLENEDFRIEAFMPAVVCKGQNVKCKVQVKKLSDEPAKLSYTGILQVPAFVTADGGHEFEVNFRDISLLKGECAAKEFWMTTQDTSAVSTSVVLKSESHRASMNGAPTATLSGMSMKIMISASSPRELVDREIGRMNLEMKNVGGGRDYICLALLKLVRTDSAYLIEKVEEEGIKKYISAPAQNALRNEYLEYFIKEGEISPRQEGSISAPAAEKIYTGGGNIVEAATGVLEIPLGEAAKRGDVFYSGEIIHGLGKGNVYVDIGYEFIAEDEALGGAAKSTIYGNPELFKEDKDAVMDAECAVKVLNDKGSFIVAVKLLQNVDYLVLTYRWVAMKFPSGNDLGLMEDYSGKSIAAETPTVVLGTKESYYFNVKYNNMETCSVVYELTEPGSGEINAEGVYTAPAKEGVYEIRIYCADMPVICTYAYAIVKKKGSADEGEQ